MSNKYPEDGGLIHTPDTDLLERLRSKSPYLHGSSAERTMEEAADEIERLRAENDKLRLGIDWLRVLALEPKT